MSNPIEEIMDKLKDNIKEKQDEKIYEILTQIIMSKDIELHIDNNSIQGIFEDGKYTHTYNFNATYKPYLGFRNMKSQYNDVDNLLDYICGKYSINREKEEAEYYDYE